MSKVRGSQVISQMDFVLSRPLDAVAPPNALALPFTVRIVRTEEHLSKAVEIRAETYGRHHPDLAENLKAPEAADRAAFSLVLLAEAKDTGEALGTMRIETNTKSPLPIETVLPEESAYTSRTIAYVTRLGVYRGQFAQLVKLALFKALHRYCLACQIDWIVVGARSPMDRQFIKLGFSDVHAEGRMAIIASSGTVPARILSLETIRAEGLWRATEHPFYKFVFVDFTPDIQIFSSVSGVWGRPRTESTGLPAAKALDEVFGVTVV
ncbi:MAG: hypothetical protein WCK28_09705 [Burkholderiales bacterium]